MKFRSTLSICSLSQDWTVYDNYPPLTIYPILTLLTGLLLFWPVNSHAADQQNNNLERNSEISGSKSASGQTSSVDRRLIGHGGPVKAITLSLDGHFALTGSFDYSMMFWDLSSDSPKIVHRFDDHDGAVNAVEFHPDSKRALAASDDGVLTVWNLVSGRLERRFRGHEAKIVDIDISADGRLAATASWDRTVRIWDLNGSGSVYVLKGHKGPVNAVEFAEYEGVPVLYSAAYDGTVRRWSTSTGEQQRIVFKNGWGINVLVDTDKKNTLIFGDLNGQLSVLDTDRGEIVLKFPIQERPILSAELSRSRKFLATGGGDGVINIWNTSDWSLLKSYRNPFGPIWALAIGLDSNSVYYGGLDDFVSRWQVFPRLPFEEIKSKYPRRFQEQGASLGEKQFLRKCSVCHTLTEDGANRAGPTLFKLFGRPAGVIKDYAYSKALKSSSVVWNEETISRLFAEGPENYLPGTKMPLQRIKDSKIISALVEYLKEATAPSE